MLYRHKIYEKYLSAGFEELNTSDYGRVSRSYELNYNDIIPTDLDAKILDLGCGMGHFLYYLKKRGYRNFLGVDIGVEQIEHCHRDITDKVVHIQEIFKFLDRNSNHYNLVVMNDVLEHFTKDEIIELLTKTLLSLKEGGRLIIKTPNMCNPFAAASYYIDYTHETGFSEISLSQILKTVGYQKVRFREEKIYISSVLKRIIFSILRKLYINFLKCIVLLDRPGDNYPRIFSKNLIVWADK